MEVVQMSAEKSTLQKLSKLTYAIQHNPNCAKPFLVRLCGGGILDYRAPQYTDDILGFGKTLEDAAVQALVKKREHDERRLWIAKR